MQTFFKMNLSFENDAMYQNYKTIRAVWSMSSLPAWRRLDQRLPTEYPVKTDQTARMRKLSESSLLAHAVL